MTELEAALAAVPAAQKSVHTLRDADQLVPDLPRRIVLALTDGSLVLARGLDAPADAPISFGWLAVVRWLGQLPAERHDGVPAAFFTGLLDAAEEPMRIAAAQALAHHPREAFRAFGVRSGDAATKEVRAVAATLALGAIRGWTDDEVLAALPALEALAHGLRAQAKKDAGDAAELARRRVIEALRSSFVRDDVAAFDRFSRGAPVDGRIPGELVPTFTFLAEACAAGARELAATLVARGGDVSVALLGLAGSTSERGLALLFDVATPTQAALATALDGAVIAPRTHREQQVRTIAARLGSIELTHAIEPNVPLLATLARFGLLRALDGRTELEAAMAPMPGAVLTAVRARDVGLVLRDGSRFVDLVPASRAGLAEQIRRHERTGRRTLEEDERLRTLEACERWLRETKRL